MPFPTRVIPTRTDVEECIHNNAVTNVLEKVAVSNMIGLLTQMNLLSKHASEVFGDVLKDANRHLDRIGECKKRLSVIEQHVPAVERRLLEKAPSYFYDNPYTGKEWQRNDSLRGLLFRRDRAPLEVNRRRGNAEKPPDISSMDRFADDGKPCIKKFTDADFFMNEWLEAERLRMEEQKRKRKERKEKRKRKKDQRVAATKILKVSKKTYSALGAEFSSQDSAKKEEYIEVKGYNNLGGNLEGTTEFEARTSRGTRATTPGETQGGTASDKRAHAHEEHGSSAHGQVVVVTPPDEKDQGDELDKMETLNEEAHEKTDTVILHQTQASYPVSDDSSSISRQFAHVTGQHMSEKPKEESNVPLTPEAIAYRSMQQAEDRMRREEEDRKRKDAEKQKMATLMQIKGPGLLQQIRDVQSRGVLKKVEPVKREPARDQRSQMLDAIREKQNLKHVEQTATIVREESKKGEGGIYAILKRREYLEESEESDSGSEWEDSD